MLVRIITRCPSAAGPNAHSQGKALTSLNRFQADYGESQVADEEVQTRRGAEFKWDLAQFACRVCMSIQLASASR